MHGQPLLRHFEAPDETRFNASGFYLAAGESGFMAGSEFLIDDGMSTF